MNRPENYKTQTKRNKNIALIPLKAGCLTIAVAGVALLLGLWLDARLGTLPRWTLILLIGSAPFTLLGVYLFVRKGLRRMRDEGEEAGQDGQDENAIP